LNIRPVIAVCKWKDKNREWRVKSGNLEDVEQLSKSFSLMFIYYHSTSLGML